MSERGTLLGQLLTDLVSVEDDPAHLIQEVPSSYINAAEANTTYFGSPVGPLTPATLDSPQLLAVQVSQVRSGNSGNMGSIGSGSMAVSGIWKLTAILGAGKKTGKQTSVVWKGPGTIEQARAAGVAWMGKLCKTFGNEGAGSSVTGGTDGSPDIDYLRVTDAINPREGELYDYTDTNFVGPGGGTLNVNAAGYIVDALALRMKCVSSDASGKVVYSNHGFVGVPDQSIIRGSKVFLEFSTNEGFYSGLMLLYLGYLTDTANGLGCMTTADAQRKQPTGVWSSTTGLWTATLQPRQAVAGIDDGLIQPFFNGDRIRLTAANAPYFNGTYKVTSCVGNTFAIANGPPLEIPGPTLATVQRIQFQGGVRPMKFAQFTAPTNGWIAPFGLKVSSRKKSRPFNPVSFPRKKKRVH